MSPDHRPAVTHKDPHLPAIGDEGQPGAGLVKRAVSATLWVLFVLVVLAVTAGSLIQMDVVVKANGNLEPRTMATVRAQEPGVVHEVFVRSGDTVEVGQELARVAGHDLEATLREFEVRARATRLEHAQLLSRNAFGRRQLEQQLVVAEARLASAKANLLRQVTVFGGEVSVDSLMENHEFGHHVGFDVAMAELRSSEAELELSRIALEELEENQLDVDRFAAEVEQLETQAEEFRRRLERTSFTSPIRGVVVTEEIERRIGSFIQQGEPLLDVVDPTAWQVVVMVPQRDVRSVRTGDRVRVDLVAFASGEPRRLEGTVIRVARDPAELPSEVTGVMGRYRIVVELEHGALEAETVAQFRRGFSADVRVITRSGRAISLLWDYVMNWGDER